MDKSKVRLNKKSGPLKTKDIVDMFKQVHGSRYDYSKVEYVDNNTKVTIVCPLHGKFKQLVVDHIGGMKCKMCTDKNRSVRSRLTNGVFIERSNKVHEKKYDYSKVDYVNSYSKVIIICPIHGEFEQRPYSHLIGQGCSKCRKVKDKIGIDEFIKRANKVHKNRYDYSNSVYKLANSKITITCKIHGDFEQLVSSHLSGSGCPLCSNVTRGNHSMNSEIVTIKSEKELEEKRKKSVFPEDFSI